MSYVLGTIISTGHKTEKNQGRFLLFYAHVLAPFILRALRGLEKVGELLSSRVPVASRWSGGVWMRAAWFCIHPRREGKPVL